MYLNLLQYSFTQVLQGSHLGLRVLFIYLFFFYQVTAQINFLTQTSSDPRHLFNLKPFFIPSEVIVSDNKDNCVILVHHEASIFPELSYLIQMSQPQP